MRSKLSKACRDETPGLFLFRDGDYVHGGLLISRLSVRQLPKLGTELMGWFNSRWLLRIPVCGKTPASTAAAYPSMDKLRSTKPLLTVNGMHLVPVHPLHPGRW